VELLAPLIVARLKVGVVVDDLDYPLGIYIPYSRIGLYLIIYMVSCLRINQV
jgi:hypothetical protein